MSSALTRRAQKYYIFCQKPLLMMNFRWPTRFSFFLITVTSCTNPLCLMQSPLWDFPEMVRQSLSKTRTKWDEIPNINNTLVLLSHCRVLWSEGNDQPSRPPSNNASRSNLSVPTPLSTGTARSCSNSQILELNQRITMGFSFPSLHKRTL